MGTPVGDSELGATSDVTPDPFLEDAPSSTVERTDPRVVLVDWFDDMADLVNERVAAYEVDEGDEPGPGRRAATTWRRSLLRPVRRYLRNREAKPGRTDPRQVMTEWFSLADAHQEVPQPFTMLSVAFQTETHWGLNSVELAQVALDTVLRYLRNSAVELDRGQL
ncbi:hypothetical protein ACIBG5_42210 [Kribbella sp. NPDC050241]|uniref:hypothetical protein n=1 Tax=Kribbella sp. NPDC050241 TaxID=3364115 RepID=UPI0037B5B99F